MRAAPTGAGGGGTAPAFAAAVHAVPVLRGHATRPLYVTAAGLSADEAAGLVGQMSGSFRLPDALRLVDALARGREAPDRAE
jgi:deoxyribonuclease V